MKSFLTLAVLFGTIVAAQAADESKAVAEEVVVAEEVPAAPANNEQPAK